MKCWRCGSVDLRPYEPCSFGGEGEPPLLICAGCNLVMSDGRDPTPEEP
jgi:hypothetical protein